MCKIKQSDAELVKLGLCGEVQAKFARGLLRVFLVLYVPQLMNKFQTQILLLDKLNKLKFCTS